MEVHEQAVHRGGSRDHLSWKQRGAREGRKQQWQGRSRGDAVTARPQPGDLGAGVTLLSHLSGPWRPAMGCSPQLGGRTPRALKGEGQHPPLRPHSIMNPMFQDKETRPERARQRLAQVHG